MYTDHLTVNPLFKVKNLSGCLARWYLTIQEFNLTFKYLPGKAKSVADVLSRHIPVTAIPSVFNFSPSNLASAQCQDPLCPCANCALETDDKSFLPFLPLPLSAFLQKGRVLCSALTVADEEVTQLVIPTALIPSALHLIHDSSVAGHPGHDYTLAMAHTKYYWPGMRRDIENHIA